MTDSCKHGQLLTFKDSKTQEPAGLWACAFCRARFAPLDLATEKDAERYRWLRHGDNDERVMAFAENGDPYLPRNGDLDKAVDHWIAYDADEINHTVAAPAVGAA